MFGWCCNDPSLCQITNIFMVATDDIITSIKGICSHLITVLNTA
jgi:hypothetical protein